MVAVDVRRALVVALLLAALLLVVAVVLVAVVLVAVLVVAVLLVAVLLVGVPVVDGAVSAVVTGPAVGVTRAVVDEAVVGLAAVLGETVLRADGAVLGVSGSSVRPPDDAGVPPRAGTVTSGTVAAGATGDPAGEAPGNFDPPVPAAAPEVPGEDCATGTPQAASSTAAMP